MKSTAGVSLLRQSLLIHSVVNVQRAYEEKEQNIIESLKDATIMFVIEDDLKV
jgi:hypothetical protein